MVMDANFKLKAIYIFRAIQAEFSFKVYLKCEIDLNFLKLGRVKKTQNLC
jgi:hypothetical protein